MRRPIIAGNWKMNQTIAEARELVKGMRDDLARLAADGKIDIILCPPFISIPEVTTSVKGTPIRVGAQDLYWEAKGAFTGEISAAMVKEMCEYVIIGHSERRQFLGETDEGVNKKLLAALAYQLKPIVCVGENLQQNETDQTQAVVSAQVRAAFKDLPREQMGSVVIAYEPIWAIGTGKAATGTGANSVIGLTIRGAIADLYDQATAESVRVQYGGSVNPKNIAEFLAQPEIDGALVGGASLVAGDFVSICKASLR